MAFFVMLAISAANHLHGIDRREAIKAIAHGFPITPRNILHGFFCFLSAYQISHQSHLHIKKNRNASARTNAM